MLDREPFLRAIFAAPADDTPRLVFADYLDEHGDPVWADLIRVQCEAAGLCSRVAEGDSIHRDRLRALLARAAGLLDVVYPGHGDAIPHPNNVERGFRVGQVIEATADELADADGFRRAAAGRFPEWYGATRLKVTAGPVVTPEPLVTALTSPVAERVTELDLSGREVEADPDPRGPDPGDEIGFVLRLIDYQIKPTVSVPMVEHLAGMREARRLTVLDLRTNNLDNDAARALARSPHLIRLKRLYLFDGNRFRGRVWQQVLDRFGPDVVDPPPAPSDDLPL